VNISLISIVVHPAYGHVDVMDEGTTDTPLFESGREAVVATARAIAVITRMDTAGEVTITVELGDETLPGELIFDGMVDFQSGRIEVGSVVNDELARAELGFPGTRRVRVFAMPKTAAESIGVVVSR
jgi:hypothetical protein